MVIAYKILAYCLLWDIYEFCKLIFGDANIVTAYFDGTLTYSVRAEQKLLPWRLIA